MEKIGRLETYVKEHGDNRDNGDRREDRDSREQGDIRGHRDRREQGAVKIKETMKIIGRI